MSHPYRLRGDDAIPSPALVVYPEFIRANVARVVERAGGPERLRPHVKTHKTREIARMQIAAGVVKHKAATVAECECLAGAGAPDVLLAYPVVGPTAARLGQLARRFPLTEFSALVDHPNGLAGLAKAAASAGRALGAFLDLDVGFHRTGIAVGPAALALALEVAATPGLRFRGLHAYDGHNRQESRAEREAAARAGLAPVLELRAELGRRGVDCPAIVAGGTPTFPIYAARTDVPGLECSPGTYVLHDINYGRYDADLTGITPAAVLLTRVISRPAADRVTLDLGHKAVSADVPLAGRVKLLDIPDAEIVSQSEEHLCVRTADAARWSPGDVVYAIPGHVCPTVALHREVLVAEAGAVVGRWVVAARDRFLSI